jgi:hypothetical protein
MDYLDTKSSSRAQLKSRGKKRSQNQSWLCYCKDGDRRRRGKGMEVGRCNAGRALRMGIGIEEGLDDDTAVGGELKTKVS